MCFAADRGCLKRADCCQGGCDDFLCASNFPGGLRAVDVTNNREARNQAYTVAQDAILAANGDLGYDMPEDYFENTWPANGVVVAVFSGDEIVSGCGFFPFVNKGSSSRGIKLEWLGSSARARGGGVAAMRFMFNWVANSDNYRWIGLTPLPGSLDFYQKRGFESVPRATGRLTVDFEREEVQRWIAEKEAEIGDDAGTLGKDLERALEGEQSPMVRAFPTQVVDTDAE